MSHVNPHHHMWMMKSSLSHYIVIGVVISACFGNSLFGDFVFDDSEAILRNDDVTNRTSSPLSAVFEHDFWGNNINDATSHKSYRPLTILAYKFIRQISIVFGESPNRLNPLYFHATNLLSFCVLCFALYATLRLFLQCSIFHFSKQESKRIAFIVSLMFTAHPIHCESISSCVGLADILSALCCVISFRAYIHQIDLLFQQCGSNFRFHIKNLCFLFTATFFVGLALLFKEQGITYLGIFIMLNLFLLYKHLNRRIALSIWLYSAFYLFAALSMLYLRLRVMNFSAPRFGKLDNPASHLPERWWRAINYLYIHSLNIFLMICPIWSCFDWSMETVPLIMSLIDMRFGLLSIFLLVLFLLSLHLFLSTKQEKERMLIFSSFFVIPFLPSSNLFFPVGFVIAERNLFVPILGYLLIFVTSYQRLLQFLSESQRKIAQFCLYFLLATYCVRSYLRTQDWISERILFQKDSHICSGNAKIFYNVAKVAADSGDSDTAIEYYQKSLLLEANYTNALNNYANILKDRGEVHEARRLLRKACDLDAKFASAWLNLAIVEMSLRNYGQSEQCFRRVIRLRPRHANAFYNLGNLYLELRRYDDAQSAYTNAVTYDEKLVRAWNNLVLLHQNRNQLERARELIERAISLNAREHSLHYLAGNIFGQLNLFSLSEYHYKQAIAIDSGIAAYYHNLGVLYHRNKMYREAKQHYSDALRLNPHYENAAKHLQTLKSFS